MIPSAPNSAPADAAPVWHCGEHRIALDRVRIMGILNVTPDSFSDGGRYAALDAALAQAQRLVEEGADILDIGGESTRPGSARVPAQVEQQRVLPVLRALRGLKVPISVDTSEPGLMRAALDEGAAIINDVRSLRIEGALEAVRARGCGIVLMHMKGEPETMQLAPEYDDVVAEVGQWLAQRRDEVCAAGVEPGRIVLDPGFGFGKANRHNRSLLAGLARLQTLGLPLLVGLSRKATLGHLTQRPVTERLAASLAAAILAADNGARIVRVHDVGPTRDALAVWEAVRGAQAGQSPSLPEGAGPGPVAATTQEKRA